MAPAIRVRPYKDFLTPALHRRFSKAAATLLVFCYIEALLVGQWDSFLWSWFPFGPAGIRAGLIFICAFSIFVLRVSQLHVGLRTTNSKFETFWRYAFRYETLQTVAWYLFSARLYTEVYIYSASKDANIFWITDAKNNERPRLNERPIYLMCYFLFLALVQTGCHLAYDYDKITLPLRKTNAEDGTGKQSSSIISPFEKVRNKLPTLVTEAIQRALGLSIVAPILYSWTVRQFAWSWMLMFSKIFWSLPKSTAIPSITPFHWRLLFRSFTGGTLLILMWEVGNQAFSAYVAQEPLKYDRPITYESRDPNGSLLTGLNGKKLQTRAFAFWELVYIAERYQGRRKTFFEDIDRVGGSSWSQISVICLNTVKSVNDRINDYVNPPPPAAAVTRTITEPGLPRLTGGLKQDNIFNIPPQPAARSDTEIIAKAVVSIAQNHSQAPSPTFNGRKLFKEAKSAVLGPESQSSTSTDSALSTIRHYAARVLPIPIGDIFREDSQRLINTVVLGTPYGDAGILVDAADALTKLSVCSLKEDPYGNVHKDVPTIIRTITATIERIESFKGRLGVQECLEVDVILRAFKSDLQVLVTTFGEFADDLGLSQSDMRTARQAATSVEMKDTDK